MSDVRCSAVRARNDAVLLIARDLAEAQGWTLIPPCDHPDVLSALTKCAAHDERIAFGTDVEARVVAARSVGKVRGALEHEQRIAR